MMAGKMKLAQLLRAIGHNSFTAEQQIRQLTGVHVSRALLVNSAKVRTQILG